MSIFNSAQNAIVVRKPDGSLHENIKAIISHDLITFEPKGVQLETGDKIIHVMSNGGEATYEVIDPVFQERFGSIPAHYKARVRKLGIPEARSKTVSMTVNLTGPNSRMNLGSVDQSTNIVSNQYTEKLAALESAIQELRLAADEHREAMDLLTSIRREFDSGKPNKSVLKALFGALPTAANISSIMSVLLTMAG